VDCCGREKVLINIDDKTKVETFSNCVCGQTDRSVRRHEYKQIQFAIQFTAIKLR